MALYIIMYIKQSINRFRFTKFKWDGKSAEKLINRIIITMFYILNIIFIIQNLTKYHFFHISNLYIWWIHIIHIEHSILEQLRKHFCKFEKNNGNVYSRLISLRCIFMYLYQPFCINSFCPISKNICYSLQCILLMRDCIF